MDDEQDLWKHVFDEITGDTLVNFGDEPKHARR